MTAPHPRGNTRSLSYWIDTTPATSYAPLAADERCDVAIVGGGIAGLTAAYLLAKAGKDVALVDRERIGMSETGHTTAHLQIAIDTPLRDLVPRFGLEGAKLAWDSQLEAVKTIENIASEHNIRCGLERLDAYLYGSRASDEAFLKEEMRLIRKIGYAAMPAEASEVPFPAKHAIRIPDQGKFHVRKYLLGLAKEIERMGARIYEGSEINEVESGEKVTLRTSAGASIVADQFLSCTNVPFVGRETIHSRLDSFRTYAIGVQVPKGIFEDKLYWDTLDPYHYTRVEQRSTHDLVIHGGEDHRVGQVTDTEAAWARLADHVREASEEASVLYRWSGEVLETADDLPYIGRIPGRGENESMVTGDSGTGMTNGTLGGLMLAERTLGRGTPWDALYDTTRSSADSEATKTWVRQNADTLKQYVKGALLRPSHTDVAELLPGEGAIFKKGLRPIAVARLEDGTLHAVSATCTHAGCAVTWNHGEASWDCPCHGSRFSPTGDVLHGPAAEPLAPVPVEELIEERREKAAKEAEKRARHR